MVTLKLLDEFSVRFLDDLFSFSSEIWEIRRLQGQRGGGGWGAAGETKPRTESAQQGGD